MILRIIFCILAFSVAAFAQDQTRFTSEDGGYSFTAPKGFSTQPGPEGFALANAAKTVVIAVKGHSYGNFQAFAAEANLERDGLRLVGEPKAFEGGNYFRTTNGKTLIDTFVVFSTNTPGGAVVIAFSESPNADTSLQTAAAITESFVFTKPKASPISGQVRNLLAGKHLLYLYTASGYSERKDIVLCSSGTFYQSLNMGGFSPNDVGGPSFGARGGKSGTWSISSTGQKLVLRFAGGGTTEFQLSARQAGNEIGMNGQRWFVQTQNACR